MFINKFCIHIVLSKSTLILKIAVYLLIKNKLLIKVARRAEKIEVFRKGWNFENRTYFVNCIMRKHHFLLWTKETALFPYFCHGIIFYSVELFDCAVNFKFYLNIFIFLNINTNQTSKEQYLN